MENVFDITTFGAIGDGKTDCTKYIQKAIDLAAEVNGSVIVPPGKYLCGYIKLSTCVSLIGFHGWAYREFGGSRLILNDDSVPCLLDMTGAYGSSVKGIQFEGNRLMGDNIHGIMVNQPEYNAGKFEDESENIDRHLLADPTHFDFREDGILISDCQCKHFSGDGIHLNHIFAFTVAQSQLSSNGGDGIYINGWDGWIYDCTMCVNNGAGIGAEKTDSDGKVTCCSITMTGNRIEWNRRGGLRLYNTDTLNVTGNFFDRSTGPAIIFDGQINTNSTITGNIFKRSGKPSEKPFTDKYESTHIYLKNSDNIAVVGNTFVKGHDDGGVGVVSPDFSVVYKDSSNCVISQNAMNNSCMKDKIVGIGIDENMIVKDNT